MLEHEGRTLSAEELAGYWADLGGRYPILSIEDGMDEEDWDGWRMLTERIGDRSSSWATTSSSRTPSACAAGSSSASATRSS